MAAAVPERSPDDLRRFMLGVGSWFGSFGLHGVLFSTLLSLFAVPAFYLILARFTKPTGHIERALSALEDRHRPPAREEPGIAAE